MGEARARKEVSRPGISRRVPLSCLLPLAPACHLTFNFFHAAFQNSPAKHLLKKRGTFSTLRVCSQSSTVKGEVVPFRFHNEMWPDCQIFIHCGSVDPPPPIRVVFEGLQMELQSKQARARNVGEILGECSSPGCLLKSPLCQGGT